MGAAEPDVPQAAEVERVALREVAEELAAPQQEPVAQWAAEPVGLRQAVVTELDAPRAVAMLDAQQAVAAEPTLRQEAELLRALQHEAELKSALQSPESSVEHGETAIG